MVLKRNTPYIRISDHKASSHFSGVACHAAQDYPMYFAHSLDSKDNHKNWQTLQNHLTATGQNAAQGASEFGSQNAAQIAGLLHDLGKYSLKFQDRLNGSKVSVDHSTAGAKEIIRLGPNGYDKIAAEIIAYVIAGHHAGLANHFDLFERLKHPIEPIDGSWKREIDTNTSPLWPANLKNLSQTSKETCAFQLAFWGRMLFSCLVDADYKDTEAFYAKHEKRKIDRNWPGLRANIDDYISRYNNFMNDKQASAPSTALNVLRNDILNHVRSKACEPTGLFTLTVPTGGGKTLASLGFALDHAKIHKLRRIIFAIPFTSIIDQSASIFRSVLGGDVILEHHSSFENGDSKDRQQRDKLRLAMEDWAAPVIVTTNVQLFESLFANRSSRCRKLHNLANSVIILDEAQTLPLSLLRPCLAALDELAKHYGATIILCTATQPALDHRDLPNGGLALEGRELAPEPEILAQKLKRVQICRGPALSDDDLVCAIKEHESALIIVNSRKHALNLYRCAQASGLDGLIHLTTRQYAAHRRKILEQVRQDLLDNKPCRLIATSLVEAGVDVDFPRVWRAEAGLDQIAQAAGRCNREGRRPLDQSIVTVFKAKDNRAPREITHLAEDFARMADKHKELLSPEAMNDYFREVFWRKGPEQLDAKKILEQFSLSGTKPLFNYETVARDFRMIESGLMPIIIDDNETVGSILARLHSDAASPGKAARELQSYIVQVPPKDLALLKANGRVKSFRPDLWGDQFIVLDDLSLYRPETGLIWENADELENTIF